ncbi:hypothetical protein [Enterococcus sp. AZ192]|uniref:hypothetical protein n=1 Tax=unclassified Enterococcus TaxID=2608891 RepID=UPI003D28B565
MKKLSMGGKFDWYIDTLYKSGVFIRDLSDEDIETNIFEDFIVGVTSYFSKNNIDGLKENGLIDEAISEQSLFLRKKVLGLDNSELWNIDSVKNNLTWLQVLELSDSIKEKLHEMWTDEELEYLKTM